ncbi:hypothetical protein HKCCE2091_17630 [Rhodobacterales bacterium HKCCE2091]|nr:hypothetical protein [Rhodobacterales bacterium HKCCE2091]
MSKRAIVALSVAVALSASAASATSFFSWNSGSAFGQNHWSYGGNGGEWPLNTRNRIGAFDHDWSNYLPNVTCFIGCYERREHRVSDTQPTGGNGTETPSPIPVPAALPLALGALGGLGGLRLRKTRKS